MNLDPLLHTLGLDGRHATPWRDRYVTSATDPEILPLVDAGLMRRGRSPGFLDPAHVVFVSTEAGRVAAIAENARRNPKPSRSKARYLDWLALDGMVSFGEYLKRRMYEHRYHPEETP